MDILEEYLNYMQYIYFRLDGNTTISNRRELITEFQRNKDVFIFLISTKAGGLGINLTAADVVIFYDTDWNPTTDAQAADRAHRIGRKKDVSVFILITKNSVEERIVLRA